MSWLGNTEYSVDVALRHVVGQVYEWRCLLSLYLDLLKRSVLNEIYLDDELRILYLRRCLLGKEAFEYTVFHNITSERPEAYKELEDARAIGRFVNRDIHNSGFSHSMIGRKRMDSLHECLDLVEEHGIPGDLMECGVWRGGACIFMAGYLRAHGINNRKVILADSFDGLPESKHFADINFNLHKSRFPELAVSLDDVKRNFESYGLLDSNVHFLEGWFRDTLVDIPSEELALLRLDGDLYESTTDALNALYDLVAPGGIVVIDDWGVLPPCRQAVEDFFEMRSEPLPEMIEIDWSGVYFFKPDETKNVFSEGKRSFGTAFPAPFLQEYQRGTLHYQYRGIGCIKSPVDMAIYMKAIWDLQPKSLIEIGSRFGGGALMFADFLDHLSPGARVHSIDLRPPSQIQDRRITFLQGDVLHLDEVFDRYDLYSLPRPWLVSEDSAHSYEGCLAALYFLSRNMHPNDLLVMEDGVLDELGLSERYNGGPNRAIAEYLETNPGVFRIDTELCDMFGLNATYAPNGYLRKE